MMRSFAFLSRTTRSGWLYSSWWSVWIWKFHKILCSSFSRTGLVCGHTTFQPFQTHCQCSTWATLLYRQNLYSWPASCLHSLVMWTMVSGHFPYILHNGDTSYLSIHCFMALVLIACSCAAKTVHSVSFLCTTFWIHNRVLHHPCSHLLLTPFSHVISSRTILVCADDIPHSALSLVHEPYHYQQRLVFQLL